MAKKRGFFAEAQHQAQLAAKRKAQAANAAARANAAAARQSEQAMKQAERARAQLARATAAEQKEAQREAQRLYDEAMHSEVASKNAQLASVYGEIDSMLQATLDVDDFVDLERLRVLAEHPPFTRGDLEVPTAPPVPIVARDEPRYAEPPAPTGLGGVFGGKKKHAEAVAQAQAVFATEHAAWEAELAQLPALQLGQMQEHQRIEEQRLAWLEQVRLEYQAECDRRDAEAARANADLDELIRGLGDGAEHAIQDYVGIVLANSVYPESFPVEHDFTFESESKELSLTVVVPAPSLVPSDKEFKYVKAKDEISSTSLTLKEQKERYASAVFQVALRTLHEVFEADRAGLIQTVALTVESESIDAGTGLPKQTTLVAVAAERAAFLEFDLSNVVPLSTLQHLNASVSKSPFDLVGIDSSKGVRG